MLPKSERLTQTDFTKSRPKIIFRGTYVDVAAHPSSRLGFACVISKKRIKRAVDRNKAKRKIYHLLREERPKSTQTVIVYPKLTVLSGSRNLIKEELHAAFATL